MTSLHRVAMWTLVASSAWSACQVQAFGWRDSRKPASEQGADAQSNAPERTSSDTIVLASAQGRPASGMSVSLSMPARYLANAEPTASPVPASPVARVPAAPASMSAVSSGGRFDLVVNNAPASQVFLQLGAGTSYNMLVSPEVTGTISVALRGTTVPEALETLRELFGYDFRIASGNRVFVYPNAVQTRLFKINYLPGRRQGTSDLRVSSSSITNTSTGSSNTASNTTTSGGNTTSAIDTSQVRMTSDADFWKEVQVSLTTMIGTDGGRSVVLNPAAGVIVVRATPSEQRQVESYLKAVQVNVARQVMLEAKIIEVQLQRESSAGVNWSLFRNVGNGKTLGIGNVAPGTNLSTGGTLSNSSVSIGNSAAGIAAGSLATSALGQGFYGLAFQSSTFSALLNFLQTQGDVQVLSSPRIATLNNQKAVLKVGNDELFVTGVSTSTTSSGNSSVTTPTLTLQPFFSGISLDVTPQIDEEGNVTLHVHPAISVVNEKNKSIDLGEMGSYQLPLASSSINETDSIVRVRNGNIVAIGGLMRHESSADRAGVPGLSELPGVGGLFRQRSTATSKRELVILIRPTVIGEDGSGWTNDEPVTSMLPAQPAGAAGSER